MKRIKMLTVVMLVAMFILGSVATPYLGTTATVSAATVTISSKASTLEVSATKALKISGTKSKVTWSSSKKSVATVSSAGTVSAKSIGKATITASVGGKKLTSIITVVPQVKISYKTYSLEKGNTKKLYISGTKSKIIWTSSNKAVATVSSYGTITPVAAGKATITASVDGKKLTCTLTVTEPAKLSNSTYGMETGQNYMLKVTGTKNPITWTSSNVNVAAVSSTGTIIALAAGSTTITAEVDGKKLTCSVTVTDPINIYVTNAPFAAKEVKNNRYSIVAPNNWTSYTSTDETQSINLITFDTSLGSYVNIALYDTGETPPDYTTAKEIFLEELSEATIRQQFEEAFGQMGITDYSITGFDQGDFATDSGNVFKTEYTITIMGTPMKQIIYYYFVGETLVEVSVSDADGTLESTTDYIVNTIRVK